MLLAPKGILVFIMVAELDNCVQAHAHMHVCTCTHSVVTAMSRAYYLRLM